MNLFSSSFLFLIDLFSLFQVRTVHLVLEQEGSSSSPATISKVPGTSQSSSTSSSSSSSVSTSSSKSTTELRGRGDADTVVSGAQPSTSRVSTKSVTCTKSTRTTVVHTRDGPVERTEEVISGGPDCQIATDFTKGGMSSLFPSLSHASSSSSTGSTKTVHVSSSSSSSTKGSITGNTKTGPGDTFDSDVGFDLGAFLTDNTEDDVPDFHARSVKSASRVERQADFVGKGTETTLE